MTVTWPFLGSEALAAGSVTNHQLRTRYVAVHRNVYVPREATLTAVDRAIAAYLWSGRKAVVAGTSAAAVHGTRWIDPKLPAELIRPSRDAANGIVVRSDALDASEIVRLRGMAVTSAARTAYDVGRSAPNLTAAVVRLDALLNATGLDVGEVRAVAGRHRGARGLVRLRRTLDLVDGGAESPQETRTRLLLLSAGLPPPVTQIEVRDQHGCFVARLDMGWPEYRVAVEYDGAQHWTDARQHTRDIDRLAELDALGWIVVRVSSEMLRERTSSILRRVRTALAERREVVAETHIGRRQLDARRER